MARTLEPGELIPMHDHPETEYPPHLSPGARGANPPSSASAAAKQPLTASGRYLILAAAFLGWMFSGVQMTLMNLATGAATTEFARAGTLGASPALSWQRLLTTFERPVASSRGEQDV